MSTRNVFDTSSRAMAELFGELAVRRMRAGRDPYEAARLAFSYARKALEESRTVPLFGGRRGGKSEGV